MNTRRAKQFLCVALSLPLCGLSAAFADEPNLTPGATLEGHVKVDDSLTAAPKSTSDAASKSAHAPLIEGLFEATGVLDESKEGRVHRNVGPALAHGAGSAAMSLANFVFDLRGFDYSVEGADAALNEEKHHVIAKSDAAKEYERRKSIDAAHMKIVTNVLQIAEGLGSTDEHGQKLVTDGQKSLSEVMGDDQATHIVALLKQCQGATNVALSGETWDIEQTQAKLQSMVKGAVEKDPVVDDIRQRLRKYNHRSKAMRYTAKGVYSACNIASCTPTLAAPISNLAFLAFLMVTGGPEQDKLLKEVYLAKCLDSRTNLLTEQAHMIVDSYHMALLTKNPLLLSVSESLLKQMSGADTVAQVFGNTDTVSLNDSTPQADSKAEAAPAAESAPVPQAKEEAKVPVEVQSPAVKQEAKSGPEAKLQEAKSTTRIAQASAGSPVRTTRVHRHSRHSARTHVVAHHYKHARTIASAPRHSN